jgi:large repetitive protein
LYYVAILYGLAGSLKAQSQRPGGETSGSFATDESLVTPEAAGLSATDAFLVTGGAVNMPTAELYDSATNAIVAWPGPMNSNRQYHSATALGDGTILLAGGWDTSGTDLATAEIYDPKAQTFTLTKGNLNTAREGHTATLLQNGAVLIAGGFNDFVPQSSAELYDPTTQTFASAGTMTDARSFFTATLLGNGKVLLAGGGDKTSNSVDTAELYDPVAGTFTATPNMTVARAYQAAALLNDGTVLLVGGDNNGTAEIYDPTANIFTAVPGISGLYPRHAFVLNDGTVLLTQDFSTFAYIYNPTSKTVAPTTGKMIALRKYGAATRLTNGQVLFVGGYSGNFFDEPIATTEIYDPTSETFSAGPLMGAYRDALAVTTIPSTGQVLISGGEANFAGSSAAEAWDPTQQQFVTTGPMTLDRSFHSATLLQNGNVLIAGGVTAIESGGPTGGSIVSSAELFNPGTGVFTSTAGFCFEPSSSPVAKGCMNSDRAGHTATLLGSGKVLLAGGFDGTQALKTAEVYDPSSDTFTATSSDMTSERVGDTATLLTNGTVLLAGGQPGSLTSGPFLPLSSAELYSPATGKFSKTGSMTSAREEPTATLLRNGEVLMTGGVNAAGTILKTAELYNPAKGTFAATGSMTDARAGHSATLLGNGNVLIAGGFDAKGLVATAEIYNSTTGKFSATGAMTDARAGHAAGLMPDGTVMVVGGYGAGTPLSQLLNAPMVNGLTLSSAEIYNPTSGKFTVASGSLPQSSVGMGVTLLTTSPPRVPGTLIFTPAELAFGKVDYASAGAAHEVKQIAITNPKRYKAKATIVSIEGTPGFTANPACNTSIAPGATLNCNIKFTPQALGPVSAASLTITDNASNSPQTVVLTGSGVAGMLTVTPASLSFVKIPIGTVSAPEPIILENATGATFTINSLANTEAAFVASGCTSVPAHSSCKLRVTYEPSAKAEVTDTLLISDDAAGSPQKVKLTGTGKAN